MIVCICRGKSDRDVMRAIEDGASSVRELQSCGIGDQCGSCHNSLRAMLTMAAAQTAREAIPCPACERPAASAVAATA